MKKNLIEVRCCLVMHDVCDFPLLSKCLCSNDIECSKGAFMYFFFFLLAREHTDYEISLNVLKKKCVEVDCCEK